MNRRERTIRKIVAWATALLFHRVEVRQRHGLTASGSQLANSSHFGGFTDPLVLIRAMDRVPRFVARDVIWNYPVVRNILNWVGAIPVHKSDDGGPSSNDQMFRSTYEALGENDLVTIFPEGITVDDPRIAHIKTGSARIALGARASGVENILLLSAGIHYENKAALRSKVFIDIGYPIDLDEWVSLHVAPGEPQDASNRDAVVALTTEMEQHLRWAAPDFEDWVTARNLSAASDVALRQALGSKASIGHGDKERLARLLDEASDEPKKAVVETMELYQTEIDALGVSDEMFVAGLGTKWAFLWNIVKDIVIGLLLLPFAVIGIVVNAIPMALVWLIGRLKVDDAVMATIKPLGAIFVYVVTWGFWLWRAWASGGVEIFAAMFILMPFYLFAVIALVERITLLARGIRTLVRSRSIKDVYEQVHEDRKAVVEAVVLAA
ncbi:MAG: 1-acyl-sn-glycerol-3-phosphate acyltransferase [Actinomycetia bacterium]|nr:1-acyl-sn-glycerol-3-phosphate acyltransferase [Actinomycetes bacterium]